MNISIKREQSEQVHSAECEKGGMKANFLELVKNRYSCRAYKSINVEKEKLDYILECVRFAPSAAEIPGSPHVRHIVEQNGNRLDACY